MSDETTLNDSLPTGTPTPAPAATQPAPTDWMAGFDEADRAHFTNKGYKGPKDLAMAYKSLETHIGAPELTLKLPTKPMDTPEGKAAWEEVFNKLGRPSKPEEYGIKAPEGQDPAFLNKFVNKFHELGLSRKQAEAITAEWNATAEATQKAQTAKIETDKKTAEAELKTKWGNAYEQNMQIAKKAVSAFPELLSEQTFQGLEQALGTAKTVELLHAFMSKTLPNQKFESGDSTGFGDTVLSPEQASKEISKLMKDGEFVKRFMSKDVDAVAKLDKLNKMAIAFSQ